VVYVLLSPSGVRTYYNTTAVCCQWGRNFKVHWVIRIFMMFTGRLNQFRPCQGPHQTWVK